MTEILEIILKTLSGYTIKKPHTRHRQTLSVRKTCIRNNHSKGRLLVPILPRNEVKRNLDREIK